MSRHLPADQLADLLTPGQSVYIPGGIAVPLTFLADLQSRPERSRDLRILTSIAPGIDTPLEVERLHPSAIVSGLFMQPSLGNAQRQGRYRLLPMSYGGFVRHLLDTMDFDLTVLQVTPPDEKGYCSLGPSVEFLPLAVGKSQRLLALINPSLPRIPGAVSLPYERFDHLCEIDSPLPEYRTDIDEPTLAIALHIASLIADGSTLQMGLGKVPTALADALRNHRGLRLFSGMLSDGLRDLAEAGALDLDFAHTGCVVAGSRDLYSWSSEFEPLRVLGCEVTHDASTLASLKRFTAVNSALEVDLFGQCNLEHAEGRAVSGAGGAPDFARAARLAPEGRSIIALNATYKRGSVSRIVPCLNSSSISSLSRIDVDQVVTEFGIADLRGASVHERAQALIGVAAPEFRPSLQTAWENIARDL